MQKIIIIISVLAMLLLREECHGQSGSVRYTAGINYTVGVPTFVPQGNVSKVAIDTGTMKWYEYAQVGGWRWSGDRVQDISGCAAPAYTPTKGQSRLVLNACTEAQNGHGPELYKYTGSAWLCLNCGGNYTAGTGIDITGTEITNTAPDQVVSIAGSGINAVTGTYPNFTVTGTEVDGSVTNELQTLSVSNDTLSISDGNSVVLPGGGVTWPLLAPSTIAPSYSFADYPNTGLFSPDGGVYIYTQNGDTASNVISIYAGSGLDNDGGPFEMSAGGSTNGNGGYFLITAGSSTESNGGGFTINAGDSNASTGGEYNMRSGNGNGGGNFYIKAGDGISKSGGDFFINSGNSISDAGGDFVIAAGNSEESDGGTFTITGGYGIGGGELNMAAGYSTGGGYSNVTIIGGTGSSPDIRGNIRVEYAIEYTPITSTVRDGNTPTVGKTIFCSNCTANDSSTGVLQTYNGTAWKNHW